MRVMLLTILSVALGAGGGVANCQRIQDARIYAGEYDHDFLPPHAEGAEGQKDAAAVRVVKEYLALTSPGGWRGMTARGPLTLEQNGNLPQFAATMTLDAQGRSRLDITTESGTRSIRMSHESGGVLFEGGQVNRYPAAVSEAGLIPTPYTLREAVRRSDVELVDDGEVEVGRAHLEKITYTRPSVPSSRTHKTSTLIPPLVTSFFFDTQTHLLVKAVDVVHFSASEKNSHLRVFSFESYRTELGQANPYTFRETLDGRLSWQLNITEFQPECSQGESYFHF